MGYVAAVAGEELIERAADLFDAQRVDADQRPLDLDQLDTQLARLTGQAMSEGGVYAPRLAALAVKQAQGDTVEAAFLLRAYRSTLERWDETVPVAPDEMFTTRRVSPAFKDVPGGQVLGPTKDYTQRLLDFDLADEDGFDAPTDDWELDEAEPESLDNVMTLLREEGLVADPDPPSTDEPADTTREPVGGDPDRDAVLQELARGETGAVTALGYSALRGYGQVHPTLAEVRVGRLPVRVEHPYTGDSVRVTDVEVTESEAVVPVYEKRDDPQFSFGYGLTFGRNERKAIGMTVLDASIALEGETEPAEDPEFVLHTVDAMDAFGFIEHLKLPHYVTFESILDRIRALRDDETAGTGADDSDEGTGTADDDEPDDPAADAGAAEVHEDD
jgi:alpha-D-ribose 1-methylphosphonate 5-triphosphate synthase subunit PhnI